MAEFVNIPSGLLNSRENQQVFSLLGIKCISQHTSVVQLFKTIGPAHSSWTKFYTGVLCFVKDSLKRSYYLRLYDMKSSTLTWEQELYDSMKFEAPRPNLITFEGAKEMICLNFVSSTEASGLHTIASKKVTKLKSGNNALGVTAKPAIRKKKKLNKDDISSPLTETFAHRFSHKGEKIDLNRLLDLANIPLKKRKGVLEKLLKDPLLIDRPLPELPGEVQKRPPTWDPPPPPEKNLPSQPKREPTPRAPPKREKMPKRIAPAPPPGSPFEPNTVQRVSNHMTPPPPPPPLMVNKPPAVMSPALPPPAVPPPVENGNLHQNLVSEIQSGIILRKRSEQPKVPAEKVTETSDDLNSNLMSVLLNRVIHFAHSDTEESEEIWD